MNRLSMALLPLALTLAACNPPTSTVPAPDPNDPYAGLPVPLAGAHAEGIYAAQTRAAVRVGNVTVQSGAVATYVDLQNISGRLQGYALFRGLDRREQRVELSGSSEDGRVAIPLTTEVCGQEVNLTLYGTLNPATTVNFAGGSKTLKCYGVDVTTTVEPFKVDQVRTAGGQ
ncbi:hypothetical protein [Deinococcus navajonensis]|uniref:Lipoprotein n=1 Tax=Deinococcus navajonensis TaxID=309884 RepID=A0ABV8XQ09_9DEIO